MHKNPFLEVDRQMVGDIYTSGEAMAVLQVLCDTYGSRFAGSSAEEEAARYMMQKLESYGLPRVLLEPVHYTGWRRGTASMRVLSPLERDIPCITLPHSPPADLEAELFDIGDGGPEDFAKHADQLAGKIVMTTSQVYPGGGRRWIHRNEKYGRALLAGAAGFIFVNHYPGLGPATGGIGPDDPAGGEALIPGFALSLEEGAYLSRLLRAQSVVRLRLRSTDVCEPVTSWNVIAELPGSSEQAEVVMLGSHYDGHDIAQGAADPASGTVAVMEAARVLATYASGLPYTIRFALWGAEEIGLIGSTQYVQQHAADLERVRFYLNMDMAGAIDPKDIILNEWPQLAEVFETYRDEMALDFGIGQSLNAHSDHFPFMLAGVPTGGIGSLKPGDGRGYGHTQHDTFDKVSMRGPREAAALAARLALRMASGGPWPAAQRSQAEVQGILDTPDYREERELFQQVSRYYTANA